MIDDTPQAGGLIDRHWIVWKWIAVVILITIIFSLWNNGSVVGYHVTGNYTSLSQLVIG